MKFDLRHLNRSLIQSAATHYAEHGFVILTGLESSVTCLFRRCLANLMEVNEVNFNRFLEPSSGQELLPLQMRRRLARIDTSFELASALLQAVEPILMRLIGPIAHVSSSFHCQVKGPPVKEVQRGGYANDYLEVQGAYRLHQDFAGASIPTSPSGVTLWVGMNDSDDWNLRLFPGSHKLGLLCNQWLKHDDPRVTHLKNPIDLRAEFGSAILFNALLVHGTSNPGPQRRVSCDIRFFPMCGFLPSNVHLMGNAVIEVLRRTLANESNNILRAPVMEDYVFLGQDIPPDTVQPTSVLNWIQYIAHITRGETDKAKQFLYQFTNTRIGTDPPEAYIAKFHGKPLCKAPLHCINRQLRESNPGASELAGLKRLIDNIR